jgi:hypothetical protein
VKWDRLNDVRAPAASEEGVFMDDEIAEAEGSHEPTEFRKEPGKA